MQISIFAKSFICCLFDNIFTLASNDNDSNQFTFSHQPSMPVRILARGMKVHPRKQYYLSFQKLHQI
jgi:hypothetical protein